MWLLNIYHRWQSKFVKWKKKRKMENTPKSAFGFFFNLKTRMMEEEKKRVKEEDCKIYGMNGGEK